MDFNRYALTKDGSVWTWGQYGIDAGANATSIYTPIPFAGVTGASAIAGGNTSGYALRPDGTVWSWGRNFYGSSGTAPSTVP